MIQLYFKPIPRDFKNAFFKMVNFPVIPRKGEYIYIIDAMKETFLKKGLPTKLKVVDVEYDINSTLIQDEKVYIYLDY